MKAVLLTGPIGAGKTALGADLAEMLGDRGIRTAVIDLDWLGWVVPGPVDGLIERNLEAVWPNLRSEGVERLVLTRALDKSEQLDAVRAALPDVEVTVVNVSASPDTIAERLRRRDSGAVLEEHLAQQLELARVENFEIENEGRPIRVVAEELLDRLGWS
jgi:tRNA uridine 5-carbamoylmethylation protein Kti12